MEKILEEKKQYEASLVYEKVSGGEEDRGWSLPGERKGGSVSFGLGHAFVMVLDWGRCWSCIEVTAFAEALMFVHYLDL